MTDKELVAILESKLPQELSVEEIETIRRRLPKSPELRAALAEQLELNESLAATIGPIDLQADEIAASARRFRRLFPRSVLAALGWTAGLVILLFVAWRVAFQNPNTAPQNRTASIAQQPNRPTTIRSLKPILAPGSDVVPSARLPNSAKVNENLSVSNQQPIQKSDTSTAPTHGVATDRADNAAPQSPWQAKEQLAGPPRPWDQAALEMIGAGVADSPEINAGFPGDAPGLTEVREWFARVPSQWNDIRQTYWHGHLLSAISGLTQFRGPWSNDNVLRLSLCDCTRLAIHFWRGQTGLSLRMYDNHWSLTAYRTQRDGQQATPKKFVTLATDDMRNWMSCGGMFPWRLDLRFDGKEFIVSRGELALLRAPFDGMPSETYFDGQTILAGIDMVRVAGEIPSETDPLPIAKEIRQPARFRWREMARSNAGHPLTRSAELAASPGPSPERGEGKDGGGAFSRMADGSVELAAYDSKAPIARWFDLPQDGLYEIEMELDHLTPGARVAFGNGATDPAACVAFFRDDRTGGMSCRLAQLSDRQQTFDQKIENNSSSLVAAHEWIKLVGGCGLTRLDGSIDGIHWARFGVGTGDTWNQPMRFGLCCMPGKGDCSIVLRRVALREFHELAQLAPAELIAQAPTIVADNIDHWRAEVANHPAPAGANLADWGRACALRTVVGNSPGSLGRQLLAGLLSYSLSAPMGVERRLRLIQEIAALSDVWNNGIDAASLMARFELTGEQLVRQQYGMPWTAIESALLRAPIWSQDGYSAKLPSLARTEILQLVYSNHPEQMRRTLARLRLMNCTDPLMLWADDWLATQAGTGPVGDGVAHRFAGNPLIEEPNKEGFSTLADFESALDSQSYHDACQIVTTAGTQGLTGLITDPRDPQLSVTLDTAVGAALRSDAALRNVMSRQFGAAGMLEVRRAIDQSDSDGVVSAASRYRGTEAAAEAGMWLGDRAAGAGEFNRARFWYRQAMQSGDASIFDRVNPRDRLAAAMLGEESGNPATSAVTLGDATISAADFESLVADMRKTHVSTMQTANSVSLASIVPAAPAPGRFELQQLESLDGDTGDRPYDIGDAVPSRANSLRWLRPGNENIAGGSDSPVVDASIDWIARQIATVAGNDRLYVSNRFQVIAYDAARGRKLWRTDLAGEHGNTHDWTLTPMRPLAIESRVFVRRLTRSHVELAALDSANGAVQWRTSPMLTVVSDPIWLGDEIGAICAARGEGQTVFSLAEFDPSDGSLRRSQPIAAMQNSWWSERTCQLTRAGDDLVAVLCGAVVCCDITGKPRWIRRQQWIPPEADPNWGRQWQSPPLVTGSKLFVTQPGVFSEDCIDLQSGSLVWRTALPGIHRAIGIVGDRLLAETDYGIATLSLEKGDLAWYHPAADLLDAQLCGGPGQFIYTTREPVAGNPNQSRPVVVWLRVADGREVARQSLDELQAERPALGPFTVAGGRLWLFAGSENDPNRSLFMLRPVGTSADAQRGRDKGRGLAANFGQ